MYKNKRVASDEIFLDKELRILSGMISPEEMDVIRYLKLKNDLRDSWQERN